MITAPTAAALKGGSCQLRSRNSRWPWNKPQSISARAPSDSIRYFEPVTVPAAPQNESDDIVPMLANYFARGKARERIGLSATRVAWQGEQPGSRGHNRLPFDFSDHAASLIIPSCKYIGNQKEFNEEIQPPP